MKIKVTFHRNLAFRVGDDLALRYDRGRPGAMVIVERKRFPRLTFRALRLARRWHWFGKLA